MESGSSATERLSSGVHVAPREPEIFLADRSRRQTRDSPERGHQPSEESSEDVHDERETPLEYLSPKQRAERAAAEADRRTLGLARVEYDELRRWKPTPAGTDGFGVQDVPLLVMLPLLGAALGLIAFAGLVGGFIVASGTKAPTYSPAGLLFIAVLAGMFSPNFIASLARAADGILRKHAVAFIGQKRTLTRDQRARETYFGAVTKADDEARHGRDAYARNAWREAFESLTHADQVGSLAAEEGSSCWRALRTCSGSTTSTAWASSARIGRT